MATKDGASDSFSIHSGKFFKLCIQNGITPSRDSVGIQYRTGMAIGADGKIYAGGRNTGIYSFNADCSNAWMVPVSGCRFTDAALLDDGSLFLADTSNGRLYRFKD